MKKKERPTSLNKRQYYMYGTHAVLAAINNRKKRNIRKIYCLEKHLTRLQDTIMPDVSIIEVVKNSFIESKIGQNKVHQGIIALVDSIFQEKIESIDVYKSRTTILILDQISDPQNIGSIIRSAAAFDIETIILPKDNAPEENAIIAKAACGSIELVNIVKVVNLKNTLDKLKSYGFWVIGLDTLGSVDSSSIIQGLDKLVLIVGSENKGMRKSTTKACDFLIRIPISKKVDSLNASNAASILFYMLK